MSANLSVDNDEIENLLRECNDILSKCEEELDPNAVATTSNTGNDLETLRGQIDSICENISSEINEITSNYEQSSIINDIILSDERTLNVECIQIEDAGINNLNNLTDNNESQDDIVFVGSSSGGASYIPVIDLCSPVTTTKIRRKRKGILPDVEIIEIDEKCSSTTTNLTRKSNPRNLETDNKLQLNIQCAICLDSALKNIPTTTTCGHIFCNKCIVLALKSCGKCPLCKTKKPKLIKLYGINNC